MVQRRVVLQRATGSGHAVHKGEEHVHGKDYYDNYVCRETSRNTGPMVIARYCLMMAGTITETW